MQTTHYDLGVVQYPPPLSPPAQKLVRRTHSSKWYRKPERREENRPVLLHGARERVPIDASNRDTELAILEVDEERSDRVNCLASCRQQPQLISRNLGVHQPLRQHRKK